MEVVNSIEVYKKLEEIEKNMATKKELNQFIETVFILSNKNTMNQIELSNKNIKNGKFREVHSVKDLQ
jgi:hypothetical protein